MQCLLVECSGRHNTFFVDFLSVLTSVAYLLFTYSNNVSLSLCLPRFRVSELFVLFMDIFSADISLYVGKAISLCELRSVRKHGRRVRSVNTS